MGKLIMAASVILLVGAGIWAGLEYFNSGQAPASADTAARSGVSASSLLADDPTSPSNPANVKQMMERIGRLVSKEAYKGSGGNVTVQVTWYTEEYLKSVAAARSETEKKDPATLLTGYMADLGTDNFLTFGVAMNTHSVELNSFDLKKLSELRDDRGNQLKPEKWQENDDSQSHHRTGKLSFRKNRPDGTFIVSPDAKYLELVIKDVSGVKERIFRWDLPIPYPN